ncbi:PEP-CTERM sorting domain-containing protein [Luteolibacter sp. SL250]|uniref:PEP-CTERM sorting domain-containing protein n=1 Tax=Luteolibacter sp. SL250 TaxID=2995170 RepID=UPI00226F1965|nr:PEP-CTERM sorting domain-containing protein [Luteolibacter sp. SL250]WAC18315.1 PEP-CTERM sorting domain-containing protein [Luteolibacter sp. SL250]
MKRPLGLTAAFALMAASTGTTLAQNSLLITYAENPGSVNSTLSHTSVFDFNNLSTGDLTNVNWDGVGTYDRLSIRNADVYGGAGTGGSRYSVQGAGGVETSTLSFSNNHAYFGMWWSAGDNQNELSFFSGDTLIARFSTETLLARLATTREYHGNPNEGDFKGGNAGEPYAFVNFFGEGDTTWDRIVFTNTSGSGFETDNHTDRVQKWGYYAEEENKPIPGVVLARASGDTVNMVPEPSSSALFAGLVGLMAFRRRR